MNIKIQGPDWISVAEKVAKKKDIQIRIDLDGCLCDWLKGCCDVCKIDVEDKKIREKLKNNVKVQDLSDGLTEEAMWDRIVEVGCSWWENLEKFPWADELVNKMKKLGEVAFLTSPGNLEKWPKSVPDAAKGKMLWTLKHFSDIPMIICHRKDLCASPNTLLIDDDEKKVKAFSKAGGKTFFWPQQYKIKDKDVELSELFNRIEEIVDGMK